MKTQSIFKFAYNEFDPETKDEWADMTWVVADSEAEARQLLIGNGYTGLIFLENDEALTKS